MNTKFAWGSYTLGVSLQTNHQIGTSAHAPQCPMVKYTGGNSRSWPSWAVRPLSLSAILSGRKISLQEALDLSQYLPSESSNAVTDDCSDKDVPGNYLLEFSFDS
ncbi:hypothetical protein TNCV_3032681 [Trichonephila clavipes]|nr:hypothetical protein TNCV_3032681 [Trichonephila clavipes]